ncbi:M42 family metallopeptidase [Fusobacterium ulcerans]|uniref:M42 family metallopeptidase n=1 Tax=Fusobacterium ulcerans TaxID=861 RepID=UPI001D0A707E|nr:M20/M25/M40 family metallo-hydrolase [Fusobacterium ulcerans]MCB8565878.1 M20/M25/M40 family metallo-hydrolase [Fusobacterium ulcerans]MCB8649932.1 M20/M25/M40 family metallo-hydrolase [Fusobacterium ulcerans]
MKELINMIEELTNTFGAPGFEDEVMEKIKKEVNFLSAERDSINNLYIGLGEKDSAVPTVALDCHTDEVGFIVENINRNGSISFLTLGGWHVGNVPASAVVIKNNKGEYIKGVVTSKPPHFMTDEEKNRLPKMSELTIDIGTSSYEETVELYGIEVGNPIVPDVSFVYDEKIGIMRAKAFDNRLGCAASIEVLKAVKNNGIKNVNVVGAFASQEEVGLRGAQVAAYRVKPDFAIVFEGSPADDSFKEGTASHGALKKGVQLRVVDGAMISNPRVLKFARDIADKKGIKYQMIAREKGSTNGGKYHVSETGIPVLVLGIPTRYIHTHYSYASIDDLTAAISLAVEVIKELNKDIIKSF